MSLIYNFIKEVWILINFHIQSVVKHCFEYMKTILASHTYIVRGGRGISDVYGYSSLMLHEDSRSGSLVKVSGNTESETVSGNILVLYYINIHWSVSRFERIFSPYMIVNITTVGF